MDQVTQTCPMEVDTGPVGEPSEESIPYHIACDYINYFLEKYGRQWAGHPMHVDYLRPDELCRTMRKCGDEFERRFTGAFDDMCENLQITPMTAYPTFVNLCQELFRDGIRWGRLVALYVFGANLALECHKKQMPQMVDCIADWLASYIEKYVVVWIEEHGGWNEFVRFYDDTEEVRREDAGLLKRVMAGVSVACGALGVVTLGAILAGRP